MKKFLIILGLLILACGGFLTYDWYSKTQMQEPTPAVELYSWTDAHGNIHYSDTPPSHAAGEVARIKGYRHFEPPFIVLIKEKAVQIYKNVERKLTKPKDKEK